MEQILFVGAAELRRTLSFPVLVEAVEAAFRQPHQSPPRLIYPIGSLWDIDARLLCMLAWREDRYLGVKLVTRYPENAAHRQPALAGLYLLYSGETGEPLAIMDGAELTAFRTAATSMFAARLMLAKAPRQALVIGAGKLASYYVRAYAEIFRPERILIWSRRPGRAEAVAQAAVGEGIPAAAVQDLAAAARACDAISTLTSSAQPVLKGEWCKPGCHVDLVGGDSAETREADDGVVRRAVICVDSLEHASKEAGDILLPLRDNVIAQADIAGELAELASGLDVTARTDKDLTVFKSVGLSLTDLAVAVIAYESVTARPEPSPQSRDFP